MGNLVTAREARANLYRLIDETNQSHRPVVISGMRSSAVLVPASAGVRGFLEEEDGSRLSDVDSLRVTRGLAGWSAR